MEKRFKIGKIAKLAHLSIENIRYYERMNLLPPAGRTDAGYRLYDETTLARLRFIKNAKELGFTLKEINELLKIQTGPKSKSHAKKKAEIKLKAIEGKIAILKSMEKTLKKLIANCQSGLPTEACPILKSMGIDS